MLGYSPTKRSIKMQTSIKELCQLLEVPEPDPTQQDESKNVYVFEKGVKFNNGDGTTSDGRADLYRKGCFVLESKQGSERKLAEQEEALATVTKQKEIRKGTAERGTNPQPSPNATQPPPPQPPKPRKEFHTLT